MTLEGTWQKRYGHNSVLGATFVISADAVKYLWIMKSNSPCCKKCQHNTGDRDYRKKSSGLIGFNGNRIP